MAFFAGKVLAGTATVAEFLLIAGGAGAVAAGFPVVGRRTGVRILALEIFFHKESPSFLFSRFPAPGGSAGENEAALCDREADLLGVDGPVKDLQLRSQHIGEHCGSQTCCV